VSRRR
jgi:uncharacterized protein (DUF2147 family)